ncbi:hypothetical protein [Kitasatospora sp. KL5]|uniref:hypothetical protein n=1 Tax=Kitasatospora sp. KL5 TaxID=3425125 RepID=UPI003D6DDF35
MPADLGVLLPLRIETRFAGPTLRLRVVPDELWFTRHDPRPGAAEVTALKRYAADPGLPAFRELASAVGAPRAAFLVRTYLTEDPAELNEEPVFQRIEGLPKELHVWLARGGGDPEHVLTLAVDHTRLAVALDSTAPRWWEDWDEAVGAGLAGEVPLPGDPDDIDLLVVTGLGETPPGALFGALGAEGRLGLIAPGTATNTVDGEPAAGLATDADSCWQLLDGAPGENEQLVSLALTGDEQLLGRLPGPTEPHFSASTGMVRALWPALWGFAATDVWALPRAADTAAWAADALFPEGMFPAVRVGPQPYGLLPATALTRWVAGEQDVESGLLPPLLRLREFWQAAAERRGTVAGTSTDGLLDLLGHVPSAPSYRHRRAAPLELWWQSMLLLGTAGGWHELDRQWQLAYPLVGELGLAPHRRYGSRGRTGPLRMPLVVPDGLPADRTVGELLALLLKTATRAPALFANTRALAERLKVEPDSLLLRLVVRALQVAIGDVGREALGDPVPALEQLARPDNRQGRLEHWISRTTPEMLRGTSPAPVAFQRVAGGLASLVETAEDRLERMLRANLDTAAHRLDPWLAGPPTRRLQDLLDARPAPRLGAYGWVDAPRPGSPGPTPAGLLHAPSQAQALTATVLRDRAVNDPQAGRWAMDLTSRTVRDAARLGDSVRAGAHLGEVLGRDVERIAGSPDLVDALRTAFPLRTEHAGRRVCDGLAVLDAPPASLGMSGAQLAELAALRQAVDAYGDLLVAEAVHHVTQGRPTVAGAAMDAAAGLSRPPELEVVNSHRQGRAVATSVLLLLPDVAAPAIPDEPAEHALLSPAALADPSAAAYLTARTGPASAWTWTVPGEAGDIRVSLADLGLAPADALALSLTDLERLVLAAAGGRDAVLASADGSRRYEDAARLVGLLGRSPAGPDAITTEPGLPTPPSGVEAGLRARYEELRRTAKILADLLADAADPATAERLLVACRAWGIAPDPPPEAAPGEALARARALLSERVQAAPDPTGLDTGGLLDAITRLVSPTGQLAVLSPAAPPPVKAADLDLDWLATVAAVRPPLARLEVEQLRTPAFAAWSTKPADPWQRDPADTGRLVVAYAPTGLDLTEAPRVTAAVLDRWTEVVPDPEQTTAAAFGFDAPAARAPQGILLAVPPDPKTGLDERTVLDIVVETRQLAHARMARPADLDPAVLGLLPTVLLPATGRTDTPIE